MWSRRSRLAAPRQGPRPRRSTSSGSASRRASRRGTIDGPGWRNVYAEGLNPSGPSGPCGFESHPGHAHSPHGRPLVRAPEGSVATSCPTNGRELPDLDRLSVGGSRLSAGGTEWEVRGRMAGGSWEVRSDDGLGRTHHLEADHSQVGPIPQLGRPVSRIMPLSCQSAPRLNDSPPRRAQALDRARAAQVNDIFEEDPYASAADAAVLHSLQQGMALAQGRICRVDKLPCPGEVSSRARGPTCLGRTIRRL